jgi:hypothetical protein
MNISAVIVTYRRLERLAEVLQAWLAETPDVWLCDCSREGFKTDLPIKIIRAFPDPGNKIRHAVAMMTSGDYVIKADDDLKPLPGLIADFERCYCNDGISGILGIHGRTFHGPDYYADTKMLSCKHIQVPTKVDFLGLVTFWPREYLGMDLRGCESAIEDLYALNWYNHDVRKWLIPTDRFEQLPASRDAERLCGNKQARAVRRAFYKQCWETFYERGGI